MSSLTKSMQIIPSLLTAACLLFATLERAPQPAAQAADAQQIGRSTLRVGMWTLWRDKEVLLKPAGSTHVITMRTCMQCAVHSSQQPVAVRASGAAVAITESGKKGNAASLSLTGPVTLTAHGETVTLHNPVTITARAGVLVIAVTLPIESYVELVVASESGPADSGESLKALAIVVRTFALHETHGHADYDLCDSTHCQLLHWAENSERLFAAHSATLATSGETLWFRGHACACLLP